MLAELNKDKALSKLQAQMVAEKIRVALSEPYLFTISFDTQQDKSVEHRCTGSIGIIVFNGSEGNQEDIMKWADETMYDGKIQDVI
jgi:GGDEF domain-containing protein